MRKQEETLRTDHDRQNWIRFIFSMPLDKPVKVTAQVVRKGRTLSQNSLYWKWVGEAVDAVADHTGHDADELHDFFKQKFLTPTVVEINGEAINRYTTTTLNKAEMSAYMERIYAFCAGLGIYLPIPEEMHNGS